jgi:hypothetical protein
MEEEGLKSPSSNSLRGEDYIQVIDALLVSTRAAKRLGSTHYPSDLTTILGAHVEVVGLRQPQHPARHFESKLRHETDAVGPTSELMDGF